MRWRDAKKKVHKEVRITSHTNAVAPISKRLKAFIIDSFMLLMPILYLVFYAVYGSREAFALHQSEGWLMILIPYAIITTLFFFFKGQTPGYKAYDIVLLSAKSHAKPTLARLSLRFILFIVTCMSILGLLFPFLHKERLGIYDILSGTQALEK